MEKEKIESPDIVKLLTDVAVWMEQENEDDAQLRYRHWLQSKTSTSGKDDDHS